MTCRLPRLCCLLSIVVATSIGGCDRDSSEGETVKASADRADDEQKTGERVGADSGDRSPLVAKSDELPDDPQRIVSLAPNVTEILFALGVGDRVVAVTSHCDYPEAATELPSVGSFANPDFESIIARKPDLVVGVVSGGDRGVFERLRSVDVSYGFVRMDTLEETRKGITTIGGLIGRADEATSLAVSIGKKLDRLRDRWSDGSSPRVLLVYGHDPLVAAGPGTFGHQLLEAAGARNALADAGTQYPRLDIEKVVELAPDRIIDTAMVESPDDDDFWASHTGIAAVRDDRVRYLTDPVVLRTGPRLPEALKRLGEAIHGTEDQDDSSAEGGGR